MNNYDSLCDQCTPCTPSGCHEYFITGTGFCWVCRRKDRADEKNWPRTECEHEAGRIACTVLRIESGGVRQSWCSLIRVIFGDLLDNSISKCTKTRCTKLPNDRGTKCRRPKKNSCLTVDCREPRNSLAVQCDRKLAWHGRVFFNELKLVMQNLVGFRTWMF